MSTPSTPPNQQPCPSNTTDEANCNAIPNALWAGTTQTDGTCNCCLTDGSTYVNTSETGTGSNPCQLCPSNAMCGDQDGYCNGSTGQSNVPCVQDPTTLTWSANCSATTTCGGQCSGNCGLGEWFAFQTCTNQSGTYGCGSSIGQWKSWLTYGLILLFLIIIFFIIFVI